MRILAVDTTTERESVAVVDQGRVRAEVRLCAVEGHSRVLLPAAAFLLGSLGLSPRDIEGYAVAAGPGSFTGLRVGISTVQGLALASSRLCLGLSALDVLAARIAGSADCLAAVMDAYRGQVFGAVYDRDGRAQGPPVAEGPEAFVERLPAVPALIGDGADRYREQILARRPQALFPRRSLFLAGTLGLLAEPRLAAGEGISPASLRPLYLREADVRPSRA